MSEEKRKVPKLRFPGFTEDWKQCKLGDLSLSFEYGLNVAAKEYDGENKYIRITDINDDTRVFNQSNLTSPDIDLSLAKSYKLVRGDILFARTGASVGKSYIYRNSDGCVYYAGFLIRVRIKTEYSPEFVFQNTLTADYDKFIQVTSMRSGQPGVNAQEYSKYPIKVPSLLEQQSIGNYFCTLDNLITLHQRKLENLKNLKKGLLQKLFPKNGETKAELRFPGFTDDWKQCKANSVLDFSVRGNSFSRDKMGIEDGEVFNIHYGDILIKYSEILNPNTVNIPIIIGSKASDYDSYRLKNGDVIFTDAAEDLSVGKATELINVNDKIIIAGLHTIVVRPLTKFSSGYLGYYFNSKSYRRQILPLIQGSKVSSINRENLSNTVIYSPQLLAEQKQISDFLYSFDKLLTLHQRKLEHLQLQKKALLQQMFV